MVPVPSSKKRQVHFAISDILNVGTRWIESGVPYNDNTPPLTKVQDCPGRMGKTKTR